MGCSITSCGNNGSGILTFRLCAIRFFLLLTLIALPQGVIYVLIAPGVISNTAYNCPAQRSYLNLRSFPEERGKPMLHWYLHFIRQRIRKAITVFLVKSCKFRDLVFNFIKLPIMYSGKDAKRLRFSSDDDLALLREFISHNPLDDAEKWVNIQTNIYQITGKKFSIRTLKDHLFLILEIWLKKDTDNQKKYVII